MQRSFRNRTLTTAEFGSNPVFNVVLAYEDFETGKHAKKTYDFLAENLGSDYKLNNQMWKFDVLSIPKLREIAAKDALMADIIVISCRGGTELPSHVKSWIESWRNQNGNAIGLVALFDCGQENSRAIRKYLERVAESAGLEFFAQAEESPRDRLTEIIPVRRGSDIDSRALSTVAGAVNREYNYPRWGLNE